MKDYEDEIIRCTKCGKEFIKRMLYFPCNADPNRSTTYECPYCDESYPIRLSKTEDVITFKKER